MRMKVGAVVLFLCACPLLYYASAMLLLVPGTPGGPYWESGRIRYGLVPLVGATVFLGSSAALWARADKVRFWRVMAGEIQLATVATVLIWIGLIALSKRGS